MVTVVVSVVVTLSALVSLSEVNFLISIELDGQACAWEYSLQIDMNYSLDDLPGNE